MPISIGEHIPEATLMTMSGNDPVPVASTDALGTGTVVLFAVPGAFTPVCSDSHLPNYVTSGHKLLAAGVDRIACVAVNDPFVMSAWAAWRHAGSILMLSDGNAEFTAAMGLELDASDFGMGTRSQRYAAVLDDGVVRALLVEQNPLEVSVSSVDSVLQVLTPPSHA